MRFLEKKNFKVMMMNNEENTTENLFCILKKRHKSPTSGPQKYMKIKFSTYKIYRDYFMVGECVRFLFTSCEGSLNERVSAANE